MAALKYKEEHNKVGYLLKPTRSADYHQIIDFLSASHIGYALTSNPIIFDSLVKQFWSTATLRVPELGPPAILATIDKTPYTITEDLVRSRLQLADDEVFTSMEVFSPYPTSMSKHQVQKLGSIWGMISNIRNAKKSLMYPRFFQTILGIEIRVTRQYKVLAFSSKRFANMRLNFTGHPMPLLPAMLLQAQAGGDAEVAEQAVPHPMPSPDHSLASLPTPSRPQTSDPVAPVLEHDHSSDLHEPAAGDYHPSPLRSSHAPPAGQPSGAELHDHKKLFKDVVGKLVKKVKTLEVKLKTKKRKMVVSDSDQEDNTTLNVDLDSLRTLANVAVAADSDIPSGSTSQIPAASLSVPTAGPFDTSSVPHAISDIPPGTSDAPTGASTDLPGASNISATALAVSADSLNVPAAVLADSPNVLAGVSNKGKYLMVDEDIPIKAKTFRQMEEDRLGEEAAKRVTRQYKVLAFSSKRFANMRLNFTGHPMPLLPAMLLQAQAGGDAEVAEQAVPHPMPSPDHSLASLPTPSRPQTSDPVAPVLEHDHSSDLHEPAAGDYHPSPLRSSHAPPAGQPSGAELHDHKKLFKDVVGKLVKKVKTLEVKLKTKKRKMVVSDSDQEDNTTLNVDLDSLRTLANVAVAADSDIPSGSTSQIPAASLSVPTAGPFDTSSVPHAISDIPPGTSDAPTGASTDLPGASNISATALAVSADSLNVPAAVLADSPNVLAGVSNKGKYLMVDEDIPIKAKTFRQMEEDRLGDDVIKETFPAHMATLIKKKRQALAEQLFKERQHRPMTLAQQKAFMRQYSNSSVSQTLKRPGLVLEEPSTKRPKSPEAPPLSMPEVTISPAVTSPPSSHAPAQTFLKVVVDEDSDDKDFVDEVWSAVVGWEVLPTPLGETNALYHIDGSTKHFSTLCQILHMVDRQDLMKLYGLVVHHYEHHPAAVSGEVLSMFTDVSYPLSVKLIERMLMHKLEIDLDFVGNDLTTAEQLIQFIKNQIVAAEALCV
uniref:Xylulose kinase-1 n=1 Tax=Tanacetum cinerariifolium TaxID=118510 RepID=A0A6L2N4T3_TANCI|nr:hypothetical protein [Tanacetum cinerariifolium]